MIDDPVLFYFNYVSFQNIKCYYTKMLPHSHQDILKHYLLCVLLLYASCFHHLQNRTPQTFHSKRCITTTITKRNIKINTFLFLFRVLFSSHILMHMLSPSSPFSFFLHYIQHAITHNKRTY